MPAETHHQNPSPRKIPPVYYKIPYKPLTRKRFNVTTPKHPLNLYGDRRIPTQAGFGVDIAGQRADELDAMALAYLADLDDATALDVACGSGGQALRMAEAGAVVTAVDALDYAAVLGETARARGVAAPTFVTADMRRLPESVTGRRFDVIVCQRAIHYLPFDEALGVVTCLRALLSARGRLYISASGLHSALGAGYGAAHEPLARRFAPLAAGLAESHAISGPVCLYTEADMRCLLEAAGLHGVHVFRSAFGNIKACARR